MSLRAGALNQAKPSSGQLTIPIASARAKRQSIKFFDSADWAMNNYAAQDQHLPHMEMQKSHKAEYNSPLAAY
ncbi:hypothetical protein TVAG_158790 [Trichomonas vaginalis G3]|uniref:Uncharacterized protein n=1 Tax=Trichomonas vaginalis (strain ATCC PRA-98 / G3) TaxID=412133 RepID=A2E6Q8_TRIV3|nr:hypothetical protein TVAGG3_0779410 [Trichomonas vaginalis G3]EAY11652.1 hypothetical protein TVAG_158790 [Trichomonas vaginalis G3]KAI5494943.1 hypothetical protein TVAGG3_0779410 [Trichomonas vaginalis G3]|eukprot:XP_001323875.1 hypothetical protein [Trichomonas vaginalis G3]